MFSNLSKGNILYGIDKSKGEMKYFTATIDDNKVAFPVNIGQVPGSVVDITAIKDGNTLSFKQIPANAAIADYGNNSFILADSKDSLTNYINSKLQASKNIVESYEENKKLIEDYTNILDEINPNPNGAELKELKSQFATMQSQFSELMTILKRKQNT